MIKKENCKKTSLSRGLLVTLIVTVIVLFVGIVAVIIMGDFSRPVVGTNEPTIPKKYRVIYVPSVWGGGFIEGNDDQTVEMGKDAKTVIAVAHEGYYFVKWSDNDSREPQRTDRNITTDIKATAIFEKCSFHITYNATSDGYINGKKEQTISYGESAEQIEAIANDDCLFAGWSDGIYTNLRQDNNIKENFTVTANFVKKTKKFYYVYNNATGNNAANSITLFYDKIQEVDFAIPRKVDYTFAGWYLDPEFDTKVTDGNGKLFLGYGVFFTESNYLYAKWVSENDADQGIVYPILAVFVDEIHASLKASDGTMVDVDYKMPLIERKICELMPRQFSKYLNELFEGRVTFKVDIYFTTIPLNNDNFQTSFASNGMKAYSCEAYDIPELGSLLDKYRSVLCTSNFNHYENKLFDSFGGHAKAKYAALQLEGVLLSATMNNLPLEIILNEALRPTIGITHFLHEFIHTVEMNYPDNEILEFHKVPDDDGEKYLLGEYEINGRKEGIPFSYWEGDLIVRAHYFVAGEGGRLFSDNIQDTNALMQKIAYGTDAQKVTAIPRDGYRFVKWSDGVTTATRHDKHIISYLYVRAIFEKIESV